MTRRIARIVAGAAVLCCACMASAYRFKPVPPADAIKEIETWVADHPRAAQGYFALGRAHAAIWFKQNEVPMNTTGRGDTPPSFVPWDTIEYWRKADAPEEWKRAGGAPMPDGEVTEDEGRHLAASIINYRKAVELDQRNSLFHLGYGWMLEQASLHPRSVGSDLVGGDKPLTGEEQKKCDAALTEMANDDAKVRQGASGKLEAMMPRAASVLAGFKSVDPEVAARVERVLRKYWQKQAIEQYRKAYEFSVDADLKADQFDPEGNNAVSVKSGTRLLSLLAEVRENAGADETRKIEESIKLIKAKDRAMHAY